MTEGTLPPTPDPSSDAGASPEGEPQTPSTTEEWAAFHEAELATARHRQSQADRAHAAEVANLKAQLAAVTQGPPQTPPNANESPEAAENRQLRAELDAEKRRGSISEKFPDAVRLLGDDALKMSEEKLAGLQAFAEATGPGVPGSPPIIHPNQAPRRAPGVPAVKPVEDKSIDELQQDLRALAPAYKQMIEETR